MLDSSLKWRALCVLMRSSPDLRPSLGEPRTRCRVFSSGTTQAKDITYLFGKSHLSTGTSPSPLEGWRVAQISSDVFTFILPTLRAFLIYCLKYDDFKLLEKKLYWTESAFFGDWCSSDWTWVERYMVTPCLMLSVSFGSETVYFSISNKTIKVSDMSTHNVDCDYHNSYINVKGSAFFWSPAIEINVEMLTLKLDVGKNWGYKSKTKSS